MAGHKSANLLLVDDDPGLLKLLGMRLTSEGFHIVTAESGQEALKLLLKEKIDLVISGAICRNTAPTTRYACDYFNCTWLHS